MDTKTAYAVEKVIFLSVIIVGFPRNIKANLELDSFTLEILP